MFYRKYMISVRERVEPEEEPKEEKSQIEIFMRELKLNSNGLMRFQRKVK